MVAENDQLPTKILVGKKVKLYITTEAVVRREFSPSYTMPDGRVLLLNDSMKEEPNLAVTLLRGLALPKDYDQVPTELLPGLGEMCSHLVQVSLLILLSIILALEFLCQVYDLFFFQAGQVALKAYDKVSKVTAECERYRTDRNSYRTKWRISEQQIKDTEAEVELLKKELANAKAAAATVVAEMKKMKEEEKEKMKVVDAKGYEASIKRAALEYTQIAHKMVNDELEVRLPDFYRLGYAAGAKAMAGVMAIQPESGFLRQLPEPDVPDLELPYRRRVCSTTSGGR